ncbi:MAG TPA: diguanylate cyclase [Desulfotomaculum sp.]|nr:diguanylate cyclase [Desulfotomaculum sp.]
MSKRVLYLRNATLHKRAEAEIRKRERLLRTVLQSLPVACLVVDPRTDKIIYYNSLFCAIWNIRHLEEELRQGLLKSGDLMRQCLPLVANVPEFIKSCRPLQDQNDLSVIQDKIIFKDGRIIQRLSTPMLDADDKYLGRLNVYGEITLPKQMEKSLMESEEKYQQLFFNSPAIKILLDPQTGDIVEANSSAIKFYGYTDDEFKGMNLFDISHGDREVAAKALRGVKAPYGDYFLVKHRLKSGEVRDVEVYSGSISLAGKKLVSSIIFDVTDRLRAEEELRESRERLALVIEGAKAGIWDWDLINNRVYLDKQWKAILGYEEDEIEDSIENWLSHWHPGDIDQIHRARMDYMSGKTDKYQVEHRLRHKNGSYRWILTTGKMIFDQCKRPVRWVGSNIDITLSKEVKELRLESEMRLREFAQAMPDISLIIDEDGRHVEVFGNNEKLLPRPREELKELTLHQVVDKKLAVILLNEVRQTIVTGRQRTAVLEFDRDQEKYVIEWRSAPMSYLAEGKKTAAVSLTDLTERRKAETMLQFTYDLQRKSDFFNDIISRSVSIDMKAVATAQNWGIDLTEPVFCGLIALEKTAAAEKVNRNPTDLQLQKNSIIKLLSHSREYVLWDCRDSIGIMCQDRDKEKDAWEKCMQAAARIREKIRGFDSDLMVTIGISEMHSGPDCLEKCHQEAKSALISARCQGGKGGGIYHYRDIGLYQLLTAYSGNDQSREYVQKNIGALIKYDREKGTDLLSTLEVILQSTSLKEASSKIFLHHKSLSFRKQRIEKILGHSIDRFETRLSLATAIKLYKLNSL